MSLSDHSAPGSSAGFSFQFDALHYLAKSSAGSLVGIETDDDVAIRQSDETQILEQDKHSIQKDAEPFGDRSRDLWNTLSIWIEALDSGEVAAGKTLFMMVTNKPLSDCIAIKIGRAGQRKKLTHASPRSKPKRVPRWLALRRWSSASCVLNHDRIYGS